MNFLFETIVNEVNEATSYEASSKDLDAHVHVLAPDGDILVSRVRKHDRELLREVGLIALTPETVFRVEDEPHGQASLILRLETDRGINFGRVDPDESDVAKEWCEKVNAFLKKKTPGAAGS